VKFAIKSASIDVELQLARRTVVEGSAIEATVRGVAGRDLVVSGGQAELIRTVTYNYRQSLSYGTGSSLPSRSSEVVSRQVLPAAGRLATGQPLTGQVMLPVPAGAPGSASTELVNIGWVVRVRLQVEGSRDVETTTGIVVLSRALDRAAAAQGPPVVQDHGRAVLGFESLSSRRLLPGSELSGSMTVAALRAGSGRDLRAELVLLERVHHGPWIGDDPARTPSDQGREAETVVASIQLGDRLALDPSQPLRFPFTLPVPQGLRCPSTEEPEFSLRWVLRGVLDLRLHQDPSVEAELQGVTATG